MIAMDQPFANDAAIKERIIKHMNKDHQESSMRYLEFFCRVPSNSACNARLENVTFSTLTFVLGKKKYDVPIEPPMTNWSEARSRFVAMDAEAVVGLGRSSITVREYVKPSGLMLVVFLAALSTFLSFSMRTNFQPGSALYDSILKYVPWFAEFCWRIQPLIIYPMTLLHGGEAIYMALSRLSKYNVPIGTRLWLTWVCSTFIEGYGSFVRFDAIVEAERRRLAIAKQKE